MRVQTAFGLLAIALLAAGCSQPAVQTTTTSTTTTTTAVETGRPTLGTLQAAPEVLVGSPGGGAEPNIAVAPDGTLYISTPLAFWRSDDGGKTWTAAAAKDAQGGGDGDIAVDGAGTLYWLGLFGAAGPVPFQASSDRGETFPKAFDVSEKTGADREWIDATPDGHIYTTWRGSAGGKGALEFRASTDGGATWQPKSVVGPDGDEGPVTHDPVSGLLYIADVDQAETAGVAPAVVHVYASADEGKSWTGADVATLPRTSPVEPNAYASDFPVVAVDGNGTAYLVYSADATGLPAGQAPPEEAARYGTYLAVSHDQGKTWSTPQLISDPLKDARFPWVAAGAAGRIAVVWYESVVGVPGEALPDEWNVKLWESVTADQVSPVSATVTLTQTPNHVGSVCTSGTGCLAADRSLLDFFEVAIAPNGQPVVAFASSTLGTGLGIAVQGTDVYFGTLQQGPSLL
ncbi:MAG: sialidase family protein [bacterium]